MQHVSFGVWTVGRRKEPALCLLAPSSYRSVPRCMLVAFLVADRRLKKPKGGRASWLTVWGTQFIMAGKAWQQKSKGWGHTAPAVRSQTDEPVFSSICPFYSVQDELVLPTFRVGLPISVNPVQKLSDSDMPRGFYPR